MFLRVRNVHRLQDACLQGIQVREKVFVCLCDNLEILQCVQFNTSFVCIPLLEMGECFSKIAVLFLGWVSYSKIWSNHAGDNFDFYDMNFPSSAVFMIISGVCHFFL